MTHQLTAQRDTMIGLFWVTCATLLYELLLTRIFSVTMWYHFAFLAISLAMFGGAAGAVCVQLARSYWSETQLLNAVPVCSLLFAATIVPSFLIHISTQFVVHPSLTGIFAIVYNYLVLAVPFFFSGAVVTLVLSLFTKQVGQIYAIDLWGAGAGCLAFPAILSVTDGVAAVLLVGVFASIGAWYFSRQSAAALHKASSLVCGLMTFLMMMQVILTYKEVAFWRFRLIWVKGEVEPPPLYETWNSHSRVTAYWNAKNPRAWSLSSTYPTSRLPTQIHLEIDASASTDINNYDGDLRVVEYLKYDSTNLVHFLRPNSDVAVIGVGGGRDILTSLAFGQKSVIGVEINANLLRVTNDVFGEFAGHLDKDPRVTLVNDDGRSFYTRDTHSYDIFQLTLIDTWAANVAGAYSLTENALYTTEAWTTFLGRLKPRGIMSCSRYWRRDLAVESYRMVTLAMAALRRIGVTDPRQHLLLGSSFYPTSTSNRDTASPGDIGTLLISRQPLTEADVDTYHKTMDRLHFTPILSPRLCNDKILESLINGYDPQKLSDHLRANINPPTDDSPYFFQMLRWQDVLHTEMWRVVGGNWNAVSTVILVVLVPLVLVLSLIIVGGPRLLGLSDPMPRAVLPMAIYFGAIGLGFLFVEITQLQRLNLYLGHPSYSVTVVLFVLLISSGLGSALWKRWSQSSSAAASVLPFVLLLAVVGANGCYGPLLLGQTVGETTPVRIAVAVGLLIPLGLFLGMPLPIGLSAAARRHPAVTPWLWAINGAGSICASVWAVAVSILFGITASYWVAFGCYVVAGIMVLWYVRHG